MNSLQTILASLISALDSTKVNTQYTVLKYSYNVSIINKIYIYALPEVDFVQSWYNFVRLVAGISVEMVPTFLSCPID